jgi:hypothetical protein
MHRLKTSVPHLKEAHIETAFRNAGVLKIVQRKKRFLSNEEFKAQSWVIFPLTQKNTQQRRSSAGARMKGF